MKRKSLEAFFLDTGTLTAALTQVVQFGAAYLTRLVQHDRIDVGRQDREQTLHTNTIRDLTHCERCSCTISLLFDNISTETLDTLFTTFYNLVVNGNIVTSFESRMGLFSCQLIVNKLNCCVHNFSFLRTAKVRGKLIIRN